MSKKVPKIGSSIVGIIESVAGSCTLGHKKGDKFDLSMHMTSGLCGAFYHSIYPFILALQFYANFPWLKDKNSIEVPCPDNCKVKMILKRTTS